MEAQKEKKVEYLELIYDLIFVYIIGRNNSLLHHVENGYVTSGTFLTYLLCSLAVIQIWNFTTFYINLYGRNGVRDHVFLFLNMYLLYYLAGGIHIGWQNTFYSFNAAWALILINIAAQHIIELKNWKNAPAQTRQLRRKAAILLIEAALVGVHVLVYKITDVSIAYVPIVFGIAATMLSGKTNSAVPVDFAHLSERAMLYVVFTFGEMIISIASYFTGSFSANEIFFSTMAFLIVVGLFLSYGTLYNRIINRETVTNGSGYMLIHVFIIFALNNISVALEFMREESIDLFQKTVLLVASFIMYFAFIFSTARYAKKKCSFSFKFILILLAVAAAFAWLMIIFRSRMYLNITLTAVFVYGIFLLLFLRAKHSGT